MKKMLLGLIVVASISTFLNAYDYDSFTNDIKSATNGARNMASDVSGNWCSGKEYFSEMKISDRIKNGSNDLSKQIIELNEISKKMVYDIKFKIDNKIEQAVDNNKNIIKDTKKLCYAVKDTGYIEQAYQSIKLRDKNEILAQVRINLAQITTDKNVIAYLAEHKVEYNRLNQRILNKANELAVLKKGFDNLEDPRSTNRSPASFESTIKNACVAISESEELLMEYNNQSNSELFRNLAQKNQTNTISAEKVDSYMNTCSE